MSADSALAAAADAENRQAAAAAANPRRVRTAQHLLLTRPTTLNTAQRTTRRLYTAYSGQVRARANSASYPSGT